jgi:hypothetical protein
VNPKMVPNKHNKITRYPITAEAQDFWSMTKPLEGPVAGETKSESDVIRHASKDQPEDQHKDIEPGWFGWIQEWLNSNYLDVLYK